jgi:hypothetical protein
MGGGYSPNVKTIVEAHCNTFRIAQELYTWCNKSYNFTLKKDWET